MSRNINLPMWADIELDLSLQEYYGELIMKRDKWKGKYGKEDHFWKFRAEQVAKLYNYVYKKDIEL